MAEAKSPPSRLGPSLPEIRRALDEHYTDAVRDQAHRYAEHRASRVRRAGWPVPKDPKTYAAELVHDAFASIWIGSRSWDPKRTPLYYRLCSIIKDRTWHEMKRAQQRQRVSFDLAANDAGLDGEVENALGEVASTGDLSPILLANFLRQVAEELSELTRRDRGARSILACWEQCFTEREEILAVTRLTEEAYDAARQRIFRLAKRLPPDIREAATDLLWSIS